MADQKIIALTEADKLVLQNLIDSARRGQKNTTQRPTFDVDELGTPEIYIARSPSGGIPALKLECPPNPPPPDPPCFTIVDEPGFAECSIYRILWNQKTPRRSTGGGLTRVTISKPELFPVTGLSRRVYNLSLRAIPGNIWMIVLRDKWGNWLPLVREDETGITGQLCFYKYLCRGSQLIEFEMCITIVNGRITAATGYIER